MSRTLSLVFALFVGTVGLVGCGRSEVIDKPTEADTVADDGAYDEMSDAEQAKYDEEMAKEMGN